MEGTDHVLTAWRKSSFSGGDGGNCVEVGAWRKSSFSGGNGSNCVEVGGADSTVAVRDTKDRAGATLTFAPDTWRRFAATLKRADHA